MSRSQKIVFILLLSAITFVLALSLSGLAPASRILMQQWQVGASAVQWLTIIFMLTMALVMPLSPWLYHTVPLKRLVALLLLLFMCGTLLLVEATTLTVALAGRVLQAAALGVLFPTYQTSLLAVTSHRFQGLVMGIAGLTMTFSIAAGSFLTSLVLTVISWQDLFLIYLALSGIFLVFTLFSLPNINHPQREKLDILSVALSLGFAGLLYFVSTLGKSHLTVINWLICLASVICIGLFSIRQVRLREPLLDLTSLKNKDFDICLLASAISYSSLIIVTTVFPLYFQDFVKAPAFQSGIALLVPALLLALLNPLGGFLADHIGFKPTILIGESLMLISCGFLALRISNIGMCGVTLLAAGIEAGNAFAMMPATTNAVSVLPPKMTAHATAIITTARQQMASVGSSLVAILLPVLNSWKGYSRIFALFAFLNFIVLLSTLFLTHKERRQS